MCMVSQALESRVLRLLERTVRVLSSGLRLCRALAAGFDAAVTSFSTGERHLPFFVLL